MKQLILLLAFLPALALAQVYRCDTPDGPVFSDQECADNAVEVSLPDESGGLGVVPTQAEREDLLEKRLQREEKRYVNRLYERRNEELKVIDAQIAVLNRRKSAANNNLAGATYGAGIDQQIAALRASRAQVQTTYQNLITQAELNGH